MKTKIEFLRKYALVIIAITFCFLSLFQISCGNQPKSEPTNIDQCDREKSKIDSLNTVKASILLQQKDSIIKLINLKLEKEKAHTAALKVDARNQHIINDTLQAIYEREKSVNTCEDLVCGQEVEIVMKDSIIESLDSENDNYSCKVKVLEDKVNIQTEVIDSKQNLIASKDSIITAYKTQQKKKDFWTGVKIKAAGIIILIETIALLIK
ncbi:MAG: hypothetical protein GZ091_08750 [Paludibacter sp.]|nr:hypothetical protein [Paludibacter sp.]